MRKWFSTHILHPLIERIDRIDQQMKENGVGQLCCSAATYDGNLNEYQSSSHLNDTKQQLSALTLKDIERAYPDNPAIKERLSVEKFLTIPDFPHHRAYVVERIRGC